MNNSGTHVKNLQMMLVALGIPLPRFGVDGHCGEETLEAVKTFLRNCDKADPDPDEISDDELMFIRMAHQRMKNERDPDKGFKFVDRRNNSGRSKDIGVRPWNKIRGWCLHQTACLLSASKDPARCDNIGAHWVVYPDGRSFLLHDPDRIIVHGNAWNKTMIGIEIDGLFAGVEGDESTVWGSKDPQTVTPAQIAAVRQIIIRDKQLIERHGGRVDSMVAHRQSSVSRRADPGSKVWKEIAIPLMHEFGLSDGGPGAVNGGYPIPKEWDPTRKGYYY
jgi:hypothetical protein